MGVKRFFALSLIRPIGPRADAARYFPLVAYTDCVVGLFVGLF